MKTNFTVTSGKNVLCGIAQMPDQAAKSRCLILGHGFTGNKSERLLVTISDRLEQAGILCVRFDYSGHGESGGDPGLLTVAQEVEDLKAVLAYVKTTWNPGQIYLGGHSLGGLTALLAACDQPEQADGLVLISPALTMFHELIQGLTGERLRQVMAGEPLDLGGFPVGKALIDECSKIDAFSMAAKLRPRALLIHGEEDGDTPAYISVELKQLWGEQAQLRLIPGADHCYRNIPAMRQAADEIAAFLQK